MARRPHPVRVISAIIVRRRSRCSPSPTSRAASWAAKRTTRQDAAFYALPAHIPTAAPGTIIRAETLAGAPLGAHGLEGHLPLARLRRQRHRRLRCRDCAHRRCAVRRPHDRGLGASDHRESQANCAPSRVTDPFEVMEGVHELLAAGYAVAATDYPGMGVAGRVVVPARRTRSQQRARRGAGRTASCPTSGPRTSCCSGATRRAGRPRCLPRSEPRATRQN